MAVAAHTRPPPRFTWRCCCAGTCGPGGCHQGSSLPLGWLVTGVFGARRCWRGVPWFCVITRDGPSTTDAAVRGREARSKAGPVTTADEQACRSSHESQHSPSHHAANLMSGRRVASIHRQIEKQNNPRPTHGPHQATIGTEEKTDREKRAGRLSTSPSSPHQDTERRLFVKAPSPLVGKSLASPHFPSTLNLNS